MIQFKNQDITVFESQLFKTTSSVIQSKDCVIVVDPTWLPTEIEEIKQFVFKIRGNRTLYLLFTHSDWDHIIGYGAFPDAKVIASEAFEKRDDKEQILEQIREFDDKYYIDRNYPIKYPEVDIVIRENGQVLRIGDVSLTFYLAEGHTNDGIYTVVEPFGIWLAGDYLSNVEFPYIYFNSYKYEETLAKTENILQKHEIHILVPGHGHVTECKNEIKIRTQASFQYIRELRKAVEMRSDGVHLMEGYSYIRGMRNFHQGNKDLIEKELGK
ncbi:MBL fold metallo-hydrolase [Neobacillus sp. D3-1R]|uniref:MBL fold metallo-hydrolase n=1 Tax=Neobacillus sp. D3-1R TaxID=3445778 RepID=UPI003F9FD753